ncbi:MAG: 50S ribosomal protein L11 methyltransferase, partial [Pseudomonadota bacterium]
MTTYTALTTVTGKPMGEALGTALEQLDPAPTGVCVFEVEEGSGLWEVGGYFLEKPDDIALALLAAVHGAKDFVISKVPDVDW